MIPHLRLQSQQLADPVFDSPRELVSWMGAVQAQDYRMAKWALHLRLARGSCRCRRRGAPQRRNRAHAYHAADLAFRRRRRYPLDADAFRETGPSCQRIFRPSFRNFRGAVLPLQRPDRRYAPGRQKYDLPGDRFIARRSGYSGCFATGSPVPAPG